MQKFISEKKEIVCKASDLDHGQLGVVVDPSYNGCVVTKAQNGIVAVYHPGGTAFYTTWSLNCNLQVRILEKGERVVLSND